MIRISIRSENDKFQNIRIAGHAMYDAYGKDIVCASVSTMVITTINAIIKIDQEAISYNQAEGLIEVTVKKHTPTTDLLLDNLVSLLEELETQYKKNIKIEK